MSKTKYPERFPILMTTKMKRDIERIARKWGSTPSHVVRAILEATISDSSAVIRIGELPKS